MSWKGFQRSLVRTPQTVRQKFSMGEITKDPIYEDAERRFEELEKETKKLHTESKKYADSINKMLSHQIEFSKALADLYKPISGRPSDPNSYKDEGNPEGIQACEQYEEIVRDLQATLSPELETIDARIIGPANQLLEIMKQIRKTAVKRDHKQLDYDRHRTALKKLQDKKEKTIKDEKAIFKAEADVEQATQDFNYFNELLKDELPKFFDLEREFIRPLFTSLYYLQLNIFYTMHERMQNLNIGYFDFSIDVEEGFDKRTEDNKNTAQALSITNFKKTQGGVKKGENAKPGESKYAAIYGRARRNTVDSSSEAPPPPYSAKPVLGEKPVLGGKPALGEKPALSDISTAAASTSTSAPPTAGLDNKMALAAAAKTKGAAPPPPKPKPSRLAAGPKAETVTALYDYEAQAHGDLSFSAGDVIEILTKTNNDNEWWTGKVNGKQGQFPGNYVRLN
ncbi:putative BAR adaptor protein [Microthyrium microscopicum]|uniref:Putative BAR adaptor protein n=1 Tax=Microthyrium microscopicum TaxID=703497 RepID=A0A6A6UD51_9PEZI|nr:putative BAR adaptor protein [Microthyrium microscopicum]